MFLYIFVFSILILIFVLLINSKQDQKHRDDEMIIESDEGKPCPLCSWKLQPRERVHSIIYRGKSDTIMHIFGCPFCYKEHPKAKYQKNLIRQCPACNKQLKDSEYVIARLFEKPEKNHVHVLGCYRCRGKR